jgi:iron complex outermembrane receptor protein
MKCASWTLFLVCGAAWAQEQTGGIEEVIVTAQKRAENVQNVPIAMQAYTGEQLQNSGVSNITDIARLAPNLNVVVQNALSQHIVIRGVGTNEFFGNAPSSVGTYMDEVTMNSSYMSTLGLFDMERVEVLRGPQNSLFGRNTTGGAVNYITRMPEPGADKADGFAMLKYGRHNLVEIEAGVSVPLGETMALRLSGIYHSRDGIWNNLDTGDDSYGDEKRHSERATFVWQPSEATRLTLSAHSARADDRAQPQKMAGALANNPPLRINDLLPFTGNIDWEHGNLNTGGNAAAVNIEGLDRLTSRWHDIWSGGSQRADLRIDGGYLKLTHDFGQASLTSISSYDRTHGFYEEDNTGNGNIAGAGTPGVTRDVLIIDMDQSYKQYTQELRLASNDDAARFRWITGLYYLKEDALLAQDIRFGANGFPGAHPSGVGITPPSLFDVIPNPYENTVSFSIADLDDESTSVYGQTDYRFTDQVNLTVGLRFTHDDKGNPSYYAGAFAKPANWDPSVYIGENQIRLLAAGLGPCVAKTSPGYIPFQRCANTNTSRENLKTDEMGGKVGLQFHANADVMFFGSYSRGFKSGKFDVEFLHTDDTPFPQRPLDVETLDAFELGFKSTLLNRTLIFNGAVFFNIWKDQQVFNVGVNGPEFFNLPESEIKGVELETTWVPAENWLLAANVGFLDTEITDVTGIDFDLRQGDFQKGHELPLSPEFTANGAVERDFATTSGALTLRADFRYQSSSKVKFSPQVPIDEYESRFEINARAAYAFGAEGKYELALFGENLTGEKYCVEIQDLRGVSGSFYCVPNEGEARYGLQARVNF